MTTYRTSVVLPDTVRAFLTPWFGQGSAKILDPYTMIFDFEAEDLWEAAQTVFEVRNESIAYVGQPVEMSKPAPFVEAETTTHLESLVQKHADAILRSLHDSHTDLPALVEALSFYKED